jgi:hypothetical protein
MENRAWSSGDHKPDFRRKGRMGDRQSELPKAASSLPPFRESGDSDKDWGLPMMVQVRSRSGVSTPAAFLILAIHL